ncbi:unnamed protein product (macronuclear) [Paramecium tetraurelia]|uniref:Uncharacterized protein n=1 Tax=Paramecium tetraurelia TaxID=5888 RepID=A0CCP8_PARTE|nr:uncharacterized protein GSPATT00037350001 [Paramecium tetraurelia]CAK68565.1 unnamed protein product [Paramecium tetraurelia]|eukprot:XP_001435962.1 hypothetical protein (macronuclear) [Paramecium tetraurelia strain d4-2]
MSIQVLNRQLECNFTETEKQLDVFFDYSNSFSNLLIISIIQLIKSLLWILQFLIQAIQIQNYLSQQFLKSIQLINPTYHQTFFKKEPNNQINNINNHHYYHHNYINIKLNLSRSFIIYNSIEQKESCFSIALNKDCSYIALGCEDLIKIYEYKKANLKQIQVLYNHQNIVTTITFMKKSNQFISGDAGGSIFIWSHDQENEWYQTQKIKAHNYNIYCLILNNNEDLFISGSGDQTIKFWVKQNEWICQQIIKDHEQSVDQLSLNDEENKVLACGCDIFLIEYSKQQKKWIVGQNIKTEFQAYSICFINNYQFTYRPIYGNLMYIYEMSNINQQFTKTKVITFNKVGGTNCGIFQQQFNKNKQILMCNHWDNVNLIRKTENNQFKVEQTIQFDSSRLFGQMSDDGKYLITWDSTSNELQIRKYKEQ